MHVTCNRNFLNQLNTWKSQLYMKSASRSRKLKQYSLIICERIKVKHLKIVRTLYTRDYLKCISSKIKISFYGEACLR